MHIFSHQLAYNKPTDFTFQAKKTNFIKQAKKLTKIQENIQERNNKILELLLAGVPRKQIVEIINLFVIFHVKMNHNVMQQVLILRKLENIILFSQQINHYRVN